MTKNPGKTFETDFRDSCRASDIFILRLNDTYLANCELGKGQFTPHNPCDYIMYDGKHLYMFECKSTKYKSMSYTLDPMNKNSMIPAHQISSLMDASTYPGIRAGFILNFRDEVTPANSLTYYLPIDGFSKFIMSTDKKSINKLDIVDNGGIIIEAKLKRVHFYYDVNKMITDIDKYYQTHEKTNIKELLEEIREANQEQLDELMDDFCS